MVEKVWAYILRQRADIELLVFDHVNIDAGTQIPAGTVEPNEDVTSAAQREVLEESGIVVKTFSSLGTFERNWEGVYVRAHLYAAWAPTEIADEWIHHVTGKGQDEGMQFRYHWLPRATWQKLWGDFKLGYPALNQFISNTLTEKI